MDLGRKLGVITEAPVLAWRDSTAEVKELRVIGRDKLEKVYPTLNPEWTPDDRAEADACWPETRKEDRTETFTYRTAEWKAPAVSAANPKVLIPAFPVHPKGC